MNRSILVEHYDDRERNQRYLATHKRLDPAMTTGREKGESFDIVTFDPPIQEALPQMARSTPNWKHSTKAEQLIGGKLP